MLNRSAIADACRALGIRAGDILLVHSSYKSFGDVDGGADAILDGLLDAIGPDGHLAMPALSETYVHHANSLVFDPAETPSRVGWLSERFRQRPNTVRSLHPTHSLTAQGPRADEFMVGHHWQDGSTFHIDSPYAHLCKAGVKIIFLGVEGKVNTTYHAVEDWLDFPYPCLTFARVRENGSEQIVPVTKAPLGPRGFYSRDDRIHPMMMSEGVVSTGLIGPSRVQVHDAQAMIRASIKWELRQPGLFLSPEESPDPFAHYWRPVLKRRLTITTDRAKAILASGLAGPDVRLEDLTGS